MRLISEANRIKDRLRQCETAPELEAVADEERPKVKAMAETPEGKTLAIQIANLKKYRLWLIEEADEGRA